MYRRHGISRARFQADPMECFLLGCVFKYIWWWEDKVVTEDLLKDSWYLDRLIQTIEKEEQ